MTIFTGRTIPTTAYSSRNPVDTSYSSRPKILKNFLLKIDSTHYLKIDSTNRLVIRAYEGTIYTNRPVI